MNENAFCVHKLFADFFFAFCVVTVGGGVRAKAGATLNGTPFCSMTLTAQVLP